MFQADLGLFGHSLCVILNLAILLNYYQQAVTFDISFVVIVFSFCWTKATNYVLT
jgi:hypothetical protein